MKIIIVGSSISALFFSIYLKKECKKDIDILILEKEDKIAKKLYATGNGRCNVASLNEDRSDAYDNSHETQFFKDYFKSEDIRNYFLEKLGISFTRIDNYLYPSSMSAKDFTNFLIDIAKKEGIKFNLNEKVIDYKINNKIEVKTNKNTYNCDKLYFASGGKSSPKLGSDGSIFEILKKHNYKITPLFAGLTPIKVKENLKDIENERLSAKLTLHIDDYIYEEEGEMLFKKDRLSGIVSFNVSSIIKRYLKLHPETNKDNIYLTIEPTILIDSYIVQLMLNMYKLNKNDFLKGLFSEKMSSYLLKINDIDKNNVKVTDINHLKMNTKRYKYHYVYDDDFDVSQVTIGGVSYDNLIDYTMESNIEKNVYFIGEILDSDGVCGGYNISLCIKMAKYAADLLIKEIS